MVQSNLRIPKRNPKTLRRPRLLDQLHNNAHRKLTFVCAPAGYGKTTLLIDFAEDVDGAIFWYRITEEDNSLPAFFENIVLAFQAQNDGFRVEMAGGEQVGGKSPRFLALALLNAVDQHVGEYGFLILDDYHIVSDSPEIVEFLDYFLEYLPDHLRVVIGSRSVYGIPTAALYIQEQLAVIGTNELAFRANELQDLCSSYYLINLDEKQISRIIEESEGWIVAILLALRAESTTIEIPKILGAREHVYHYLANEVVSALPEYLKEFMFATSIVEEFSVPFANFLLGIENSDEVLKELEELNLFLSDTDSGQEVIYRYHQLFSEFLTDRLGEVFGQKAKQFHRRAGEWLENTDKPEMAVRHYLKADAAEKAARVIDQCAQELFVTGQTATLRTWHQTLDEYPGMIQHSPLLLLSMAKSEITIGEYAIGGEMLDLAETVLLERKDFSNYANLLVTRGMIFRFTGRFKEALETAELAQGLVAEHNLNRLYWDQAERLKGIVSYFLGNAEDAFTYLKNAASGFREAVREKPERDQIHDLMMTLADIGHFGLANGRIFDSQKSFREAVELSKKIPGNYSDVAIAYNNYAYLNFLLGDYVQAWRNYLLGFEAAKAFQLENYMAHIMNGQADVLRDIGEFDAARNLYEESLEFSERIDERYAWADALAGLVEVEARTGFFNKALYYAREIARIQEEDLNLPEHTTRFGKVYLEMGQLEMAKQSFENAILAWGKAPAPRQEIVDAYYHFGNVCYQLGEIEKAVHYLKMACQMVAALGYDQFLVVAAKHSKGFLENIQTEIQTPQMLSLQKRAKKPFISKDQLEQPTEEGETVETSLQVIAFGRDSVRLNGEVIRNARWLSAGARAMFYFILDRKEVTKDQIALEFWPEFSPGKVNSNFHATLWRVRNALGGKHMIEFKGNAYHLNPEVSLFYDVEQYERLAHRLDEDLSETEMRTLLRQCLELYQGDYLTSIDMSWADQRRTELRNLHIRLLVRLARIELGRKNYAEAGPLYDQLLALEPYEDIFHQEKMATLVGLGQVNAARQHFQDYRKFLEKEIGVEPDVEITQYFSSL